MAQRLPSGRAALPIVTELPACCAAAGRIEISGNSQQRKMSWLGSLPFASIDLRPANSAKKGDSS
jgi:hypothetical protein